MRNLVTLIVLLFANLCGVYANDCKVTYALDEGLVMYVIDSEFNTVDNGGYVAEGKNQLVIAIGCTGGHHRSVTLAEQLYVYLKGHEEYGLRIEHRDIRR